jgi:hypothetical protein
MKFYALGFLISALVGSAICMTLAVLSWQAKGCVEWGLILMVLGVAVKAITETL